MSTKQKAGKENVIHVTNSCYEFNVGNEKIKLPKVPGFLPRNDDYLALEKEKGSDFYLFTDSKGHSLIIYQKKTDGSFLIYDNQKNIRYRMSAKNARQAVSGNGYEISSALNIEKPSVIVGDQKYDCHDMVTTGKIDTRVTRLGALGFGALGAAALVAGVPEAAGLGVVLACGSVGAEIISSLKKDLNKKRSKDVMIKGVIDQRKGR